ncbi:unnamed protein product [Brassica oleracea var. botrytis]|uniref:BnaC01g37080D protein n=3 Tax=Brassica TaxID=3705 RepID=A0A078H3L4_BRANA|nr:hypothetical protein HID58_044130 [Brassica napus]CAF2078988.1 unnamed protein product [Brassica napus]CDY33235.1 BnaC01g37080D [Brassica napus]VDD52590.1 unnamed protein product [Brassica oleracea]
MTEESIPLLHEGRLFQIEYDIEAIKSRPFRVSLLIHGHNENGSRLYYYIDPSGPFWQGNEKANRSGSEGDYSYLQEKFNTVALSNANNASCIKWLEVSEPDRSLVSMRL